MYIGGGDTVKLLKEVHKVSFDEYLRKIAQKGIPLYGGSAGAIILGEDIRTTPEAKHLVASKAMGIKIVSPTHHRHPGKGWWTCHGKDAY